MSAVFISHSEARDEAQTLNDWLASEGWDRVFLDFHDDGGIRGGDRWKSSLFRHLSRCQVMIFLASEKSLASSWCLAEVHIAQYLNKRVIPVRLDACDTSQLFPDIQVIDFPRAGSFRALQRAIDQFKLAAWSPGRSPYPGLDAMDELDAAVFFGRADDQANIGERLNSVRAFGDVGMVAIVGASGVGKTSLLKAGVLPELRRDQRRWLVVGPIRPRTDALEQLARAAVAAFKATNSQRVLDEVLVALETPATAAEIWQDLLDASSKPDARVLIVIDQLEEALSVDSRAQDDFFRCLTASTVADGAPAMALATLRSDFVGPLQRQFPSSRSVDLISVGPLERSGLSEVIRGPASRAGIAIHDSLHDRLLEDCPNGEALPLLAFTLSKLNTEFGDRVDWTVDLYNRIGGMGFLIDLEAEGILAAFERDGGDLVALEKTFLELARLGDDGLDSQWLRRSLPWSLVPTELHDVIEQFVRRRLLVTSTRDAVPGDEGERIVEVSHESLFRFWDRYSNWLTENMDEIRLRESLLRAAEEWDRLNRRSDLLLSQARVEEAEGLAGITADQLLIDFVNESKARAQRQTEADARRKRRAAVVASAVAGFMAVLAAVSAWSFVRARAEAAQSEAQALAATAENLVEQNPAAGLALAAESVRLTNPPRADAELALLEARRTFDQRIWQPVRSGWVAHNGPAHAVSVGPDGVVASGGDDGIALHQSPQGEPVPIAGPDTPVRDVDFSDRGSLAAGLESGDLWVWASVRGGSPITLKQAHDSSIWAVRWHDDTTLVTGGADEQIRIWDVESDLEVRLVQTVSPDIGAVQSIDIDRSGRILAGGTQGRLALIDREGRVAQLRAAGGVIWAVAAAEGLLASSAGTRNVNLWNDDLSLDLELEGHTTSIRGLEFADNGMLVSAGEDGSLRLWHNGEQIGPAAMGHAGALWDLSMRGNLVASAGNDGVIRLWEPLPRTDLSERLPGGEPWFYDVATTSDRRILAGGENGIALLWNDLTGDPVRLHSDSTATIQTVAFGGDGAPITADNDGVIRIWDRNSNELAQQLLGHTEEIWSVAVAADGRIVSGGEDGTVRLWDPVSGSQIGSSFEGHEGTVFAVAISEADRIASGGQDGRLRIWDPTTGAQLMEIDVKGTTIHSVAFIEEHLVLTGTDDGEIAIWDVSGETPNQPVRQFVAHPGRILAITPGPAGLVATGSADGHLGLTHLNHEAPVTFEVLGPEGLDSPLHAIAFLDDGSFVTVSADGGAQLYQPLWDSAEACRRASPYLESDQRPPDLAFSEAACEWPPSTRRTADG